MFSTLFIIVFLIIIGTFIFRAVSGFATWQSNNRQPILTVCARVVAKRTQVHRNVTNNNGQVFSSNTTSYYVTFEVQSGDRMEFRVFGPDYGMMAEGDLGDLTFQGTRFHGFVRTH
ncbi:MAG: DUF2500 domain-containing protein [Alicyclobacillus sp.]|nr:DUF2500 domain-containing protein [Alicyclobacillus sp.]